LFGPDGDLLRLGAVYVDLGARPRLKSRAPDLARNLADASRATAFAVYIGCEEPGDMVTQLGFAFAPESQLELLPLRERAGDVPGLLQQLLGPEALEKLGEPNRKSLARYRWRGNYVELTDACEKLRHVVENDGNLRAAARATGLDHSTYARLIEKLGLTFS
jgi:hypothetical protein